jgi:hypothetical protein
MVSMAEKATGEKLLATVGKFLTGLVAFRFWITPELERRKAAGELSDDFTLRAAQIIFTVDTEAPEVRLNEEVQAVVRGKLTRPVEKGELVMENDIEGVAEILLTDLDPDAGHLTFVLHKGEWVVRGDLRLNASKSAAHVAAAREFLESARWAAEHGHARAFVDTLLSATELMAKGFLIWAPENKTLLSAKSHGSIHALFNKGHREAKVDGRHTSLLNQLAILRQPARYLAGDFELTSEEMSSMLATADEMYETFLAASPKRITVEPELLPTTAR